MKGLRPALVWGVSSIALAASAQTVSAQQTTDRSPDNDVRVIQGSDPTRPTGALTADQVEGAESDQDIVVTGVRESLRSAQAIKRNSNQIVDSVQAQDIGRLPDANTTEALQRITGVQIQRRYGEGATDFDHRTQPAITIRGLTQTLNLVDGRSVFSAAGSRALDLEGIPPELLAGIDVYKNPPAGIVEGGIGGAVNLRTRLPFDSAKQIVSVTAKGNYYDRAKAFGGSASALYSDRFDTGVGEMGLLLNAVYARSEYAQHAILVGEQAPAVAGTVAGAPANAKIPLGFQIYDDNGNRTRLGVAGAFQWQAASNVLVTAQAQFTRYTFDRLGTYVYPNNRYEVTGGTTVPTPAAGSPFTFDNQGFATSGAIRGQLLENGRFDQALRSHTGNYTFNVAWEPQSNLKLVFDAQYLKSVYDADRNGLVLSQLTRTFEEGRNSPNAQTVTFDLRGKRPVWNVSNPTRLTDAASYSIPFIADSRTRNDADQLALSYDIEYDIEGGFLQKLRGGMRYTDSGTTLRGTWNGVCLYSDRADNGPCDVAGKTFPRLSSFPQLFMGGPSTPDFFDGRTLPGGVLYPEFLPGRDLWDRLGSTYALVGARRKLNFDPADITRIDEKTWGVYGAADYAADLGDVRIDGNVGVRLVRTDLASTGTQFVGGLPAGQLVTEKRYLSALPSFNIRARLTDTFQIRGAYSKAITRPNFDQLSTNLSLGAANQINPITGRPSANQGNPNLDPIKSDNYDVTAEWYFSPTGSLTGGLFYKTVDGFIFSDSVVRVYNGRAYDTATSINSGKGKIKGFEVAYQQFFDFLPGLLSGFGVQANYTYADSSAERQVTNLVTGTTRIEDVSLEKLSKHSYNLVGLYEKGPLTARLAWNWRGRYLDTTTGSGANGRFQFQEPYATLDASINVNLNSHIAVGIDAVNLNNRMGVTYIDSSGQPLQYTLNDRRFGLTLRATY
jgi:TonB-dependent receptor